MSETFRGNLYTYSGKTAYPEGAPSIVDIAISLSREGRYAGAGIRWWPVALHTFVVCDLLPKWLKFDGLMHDASECITGDAPKPTKTDAFEQLEKELTSVIYKSVGVTLPSELEHSLIKAADTAAKQGEVYTVGTKALQEELKRHNEAEELVIKYRDTYGYADCLEPYGAVPTEFIKRFHIYKNYLEPNRILKQGD